MADLEHTQIQYISLYCPQISESQIIYLNVGHFIVILNEKYYINGEEMTLIKHLRESPLGIDRRTINRLVVDADQGKNKKCCSRLVCEEILIWMYSHENEGWPYAELNLKMIDIKEIKVTAREISQNLGGKGKLMPYFEENKDGQYTLKVSDLKQFKNRTIQRFLKIAQKKWR